MNVSLLNRNNNEKPMDTDPIGDNAAMSVDGDISYSSIDMDETLLQGGDTNMQVKSNMMMVSKKATGKNKHSGVVQQAPLKFKEANSSLHLI